MLRRDHHCLLMVKARLCWRKGGQQHTIIRLIIHHSSTKASLARLILIAVVINGKLQQGKTLEDSSLWFRHRQPRVLRQSSLWTMMPRTSWGYLRAQLSTSSRVLASSSLGSVLKTMTTISLRVQLGLRTGLGRWSRNRGALSTSRLRLKHLILILVIIRRLVLAVSFNRIR